MRGEDLAALAADLRNEGFDARNLAQVGITIWESGVGHFYSLTELNQSPTAVARRDFRAIRSHRGDDRFVAS